MEEIDPVDSIRVAGFLRFRISGLHNTAIAQSKAVQVIHSWRVLKWFRVRWDVLVHRSGSFHKHITRKTKTKILRLIYHPHSTIVVSQQLLLGHSVSSFTSSSLSYTAEYTVSFHFATGRTCSGSLKELCCCWRGRPGTSSNLYSQHTAQVRSRY